MMGMVARAVRGEKIWYIFSATWVQTNLSLKIAVSSYHYKTLHVYPILWNEDLDFGAKTCSLWKVSLYGLWFKHKVRHFGRPGVLQLRCVMVATHTLVSVHCTGTSQQYTHTCMSTQAWCGPHRENYSRVIILLRCSLFPCFLATVRVSLVASRWPWMNRLKCTSCEMVHTQDNLVLTNSQWRKETEEEDGVHT